MRTSLSEKIEEHHEYIPVGMKTLPEVNLLKAGDNFPGFEPRSILDCKLVLVFISN